MYIYLTVSCLINFPEATLIKNYHHSKMYFRISYCYLKLTILMRVFLYIFLFAKWEVASFSSTWLFIKLHMIRQLLYMTNPHFFRSRLLFWKKFFLQYHPNEIWDKLKNKLMRESYFFHVKKHVTYFFTGKSLKHYW